MGWHLNRLSIILVCETNLVPRFDKTPLRDFSFAGQLLTILHIIYPYVRAHGYQYNPQYYKRIRWQPWFRTLIYSQTTSSFWSLIGMNAYPLTSSSIISNAYLVKRILRYLKEQSLSSSHKKKSAKSHEMNLLSIFRGTSLHKFWLVHLCIVL